MTKKMPSKRREPKLPRPKVVDMNYPPEDMPLAEQEEIWGEPATKEELAEIEEARRSKLPSSVRPRPV